jgi:hypothetical protein
MPAHLGYERRQHADPLRDPFKDRRDAAGMKNIANLAVANNVRQQPPFEGVSLGVSVPNQNQKLYKWSIFSA